jgi:cytochrome c-type biogenesis protein CcmH
MRAQTWGTQMAANPPQMTANGSLQCAHGDIHRGGKHEGLHLRTFAQDLRPSAYRRFLVVAATLLVMLAGFAHAQSAEVPNADPKTESRLKVLAEELRCLVCQNQTIADSNAPLAVDLRGQIRTQIGQGKSDDQIRDYMVQRYGDFVLYRPPFKATTVLLWVGPFALVLVGFAIFAVMVRRQRPPKADVKPARREELEKLLDPKS